MPVEERKLVYVKDGILKHVDSIKKLIKCCMLIFWEYEQVEGVLRPVEKRKIKLLVGYTKEDFEKFIDKITDDGTKSNYYINKGTIWFHDGSVSIVDDKLIRNVVNGKPIWTTELEWENYEIPKIPDYLHQK